MFHSGPAIRLIVTTDVCLCYAYFTASRYTHHTQYILTYVRTYLWACVHTYIHTCVRIYVCLCASHIHTPCRLQSKLHPVVSISSRGGPAGNGTLTCQKASPKSRNE